MNFERTKKALKNLCPQCSEGPIFRDFFTIYPRCPECGYVFKKGQGYFTGSLVINYSICTILLMPIFLFLVIAEFSTALVIGVPLFLLILLQPFMVHFSRLMWIHTDYRITHSKE